MTKVLGKIAVVHIKPEEADPVMAKLRSAKLNAVLMPFPPKFKKDDAPRAVVLSLERMPSFARWIGFGLRKSKWSRHIPLVFVDGEPDKVATVKRVFPDATFTVLKELGPAVRKAMTNVPEAPSVPESHSDPTRSMSEKFVINPGYSVAVINEPPEFQRLLGDVPEDVEFTEWPDRRTSLTIWFVRSFAEFEEGLESVLDRIGKTPIWICWPKRASNVRSDVTMTNIREVAMRYNRVDVKVLRVDRTWSASLIYMRRQR